MKSRFGWRSSAFFFALGVALYFIPTKSVVASEEILKTVLTHQQIKDARLWKAPDYSNQTQALGWSSNVFEIPEGLTRRVAFWRDIYSKYTSDQGVLHDSAFVDFVYANIDLPLPSGDSMAAQITNSREREKLIDGKRSEIISILKSLHGRTSSDGLSGEALRIWKMFESINDPQKFLSAASKSRVRFQLGQKDKIALGIYYSGRYIREMEQIFRNERLPIELTRLPFVESSFNINAQSKVGASGIWQFMPRTAKAYMMVTKDVDERNDPFTATRASARLLKQNYSMLRSWPLAVTGYNHGAYGVKRLVNRIGSSHLPDLIRGANSESFGFASENFYACFLAILDVEKNANQHFDPVKWSHPIDAVEFKIKNPLAWKVVVELFDGKEELANTLNPHLSSRVRSGKSKAPKGSFLRVPIKKIGAAQALLNLSPKRGEKVAKIAKVKKKPARKTRGRK
jgi:membrane-bound lytic murein transglycosylase D